VTIAPHDQTRGDSTPYIEAGQSALLSRNEVASLCMKAARGAGMGWGLAEEAGFAAAWLVHHGIDGPRHLMAHLESAQGRAWGNLCPTVAPGAWLAPANGSLCPIALGATLGDYAGLPEGLSVGSPLKIGKVDHPVLLIPFLAGIAGSSDTVIDIGWAGGAVCLDGGHDALMRAVTALDGQHMPISLTARTGRPRTMSAGKIPAIAADTIAALNILAMRTTVPASESSRAGAGSAATDND
jgi:hypothetical protein